MKIGYIVSIIFICIGTTSSQIVPQINSSTDTTKIDLKQIYKVYKNYLNSRPDSVYRNPYWNMEEKPLILGHDSLPLDRFFWSNYWWGKILPKCKFTILTIDKSYDTGFYKIRTLINDSSSNSHWNGWLNDPPFITVYYAIKSSNGWKLENAICEETKNWKHYNTKYVQYIYPPEYKFHTDLANKADSFCTALLDTFGIESVAPFEYYITTSTEQMGRLFNMEYWGAPTFGYSLFTARQIISARATEYHIHEFVHMLLPRSKNSMIEEGIATYFAGSGSGSFKQGLTELSDEIKNNDTISFSDIYNQKYYHMHDSYPFYITGAVVCKFVYEKQGIAGLKELINCPGNKESDFDLTILKTLGMDEKAFEKKVMQFIKTYSGLKL